MKLADIVTVVELGRVAWTRPRAAVSEEELAAVYLSAALETDDGQDADAVPADEGDAAHVAERRGADATS
jgi:hypothetical protein